MLINYQAESFFDEMMDSSGNPKAPYKVFNDIISEASAEGLQKRQERAQLNFLKQGITFTLDEYGTERTLPFDFVPIIIPEKKWKEIEKGLKQRVEALSHFLKDIYSEKRIIKEEVVPKELLENSVYYNEEQVSGTHFNDHIFIAGIDLIRDENGEYRVMEDNLRNPSGISYVYQNRHVMRQVYPELFYKYSILPLENQFKELQKDLFSHAPRNAPSQPHAVLLTTGVNNAAYYDHVFLAKQLGIELVEGRDLVVENDIVYKETTSGLERVDIIYRRFDDEHLDPEAFDSDSEVGAAGIMEAYKKGNVAILNGVGSGAADDKAIYAFVPEMIRFYLEEEPILNNVTTYFLRDSEQREYVLENLEKLVIKNVGASGGDDMLIGPNASEEEITEFRKKIKETPNQYIAQPTIELSRAPAFQEGEFRPRHIDLRIFVTKGEKTSVFPGGLSRVALKEDNLVVNSSQGGGVKDIWVINAEGGEDYA
ncbi:circularly permuted type 2 ATP-grasp protein [Halobacillus massiliensis]|uniref:circularly permuted type 2 ATP-grasp protein n=1 Tax=Halobacillus massiliensis TaxID=1926286 RepID=UPI0009E4F393|nr:circularly permuted type 2 ATP-grasp protein [Halobacillus massiliensis]